MLNGFQAFIKVLKTDSVILPYGLSEDIKITRGVRRGCSLSPVLFIMFLDPLMLMLEELKKGYVVDEGKPIPGGAYADNMVLHTNTKKQLQKLLDKLARINPYKT